MESKLIFSNSNILNNYFRLLRLLVSNKRETSSSLRTAIRFKLIDKKTLLRLYKRLVKLKTLTNVLQSQFLFSYFLLKRYFLSTLPWFLSASFNARNIAFFLYHFLVLYRAIFLIKMVLDWFPIKNWDRASPLKRFLRRVTIAWTRQFEKYFPSIFAWLIVINIIPTFLYFIETFYVASDFSYFPISYHFDEVVEFVTEANLHTF